MIEIVLLLIDLCRSWQIVEELCKSTSFDHGILPRNWCSSSVPRCNWANLTCDSSNELLTLELFNVPLNIELPNTIDAPGPNIRTLKMVGCGLRGVLPQTFFGVSSLRVIDLSNNAIEGSILAGVVRRYEEFSVANNKMGGNTDFWTNGIGVGGFQNLTRLNLANNSFTENWMMLTMNNFPVMLYFNIEGNQFFGQAPGLSNVRQYRIGRNYFSLLVSDGFNPPAPSDSQRLSDCDTTDVPFRSVVPDWVKAVPNQCHYRYDPSNHLFVKDDFTQRTTATTTTAPQTLVGGAPKTTSTTTSVTDETSTMIGSTTKKIATTTSPNQIPISNDAARMVSIALGYFYLARALY